MTAAHRHLPGTPAAEGQARRPRERSDPGVSEVVLAPRADGNVCFGVCGPSEAEQGCRLGDVPAFRPRAENGMPAPAQYMGL